MTEIEVILYSFYFLTYKNVQQVNNILMIELRIKEIRLKRSMSQEELSKLSSVSASYISELESNSKMPTILTLCKLADALDVDVSELYIYKKK